MNLYYYGELLLFLLLKHVFRICVAQTEKISFKGTVWVKFLLLFSLSDDTGNRLRFQLELEFVQCLANPNYLNFLAQRGYFKDKAFVNYLKYLLYWKEPEYAKYLKYPQCLHMLELLQYEHFRKELVNAQCAKFIDEQQILHWQHYSRKRMRLQQALAEQQQQNTTSVK
uniref:Mediator of RNA polymerase II transcription subunit 31 n=3 Tax=Telluraves TaxID=3073808 RepID=A0A8B9G3T7_9PSIT